MEVTHPFSHLISHVEIKTSVVVGLIWHSGLLVRETKVEKDKVETKRVEKPAVGASRRLLPSPGGMQVKSLEQRATVDGNIFK